MREPTAIKLFVGQVPREWSESDLKTIFEPFGEIHSLNLLQDKASGQHKGCAFLTYFENDAAKAAQEELHEKRTLPGARNPIQVKPASSETSEDNRKLFVGMISRSADESELKDMFSPHGTIEDVTILKADGQSKGCAFIKFETRLQAQNAIKALHNSQTMKGCRAPIVVKIADTDKDKIKKRNVQGVGAGGVGAGVGVPQFGAGVQAAPFAGGVAGLAQQVAYYQQVFAQMGLPQLIAAAPGGVAGQQLPASQTPTVRSTAGYGASAGGYSAPGYTSAASAAGDNTIQQAYSGMQQYMATNLAAPYATAQNGAQQFTNSKKEGPEGANLFIYQVPQEFNDADLMQTFMPFGTVVSAKVFIDKTTGMSKGFGFVSYDNAASANAAIASMNGFAIGSKKLKVQLKRPKDQSKPY